MGIAAILVMWPEPFEQTFVPPSHGGSRWNFTFNGKAVSEEKLFKECGRWRRTIIRACLYYKLTYEPKGSDELKKSTKKLWDGLPVFRKPEDHWSCIAHLSAEDMLN